MKFFRGRWFLLISGGVALIALLNVTVGFLALKRLEKKAGAPIQGTFRPRLFFPSFTLENSHLDWQGRFQVLSGTVRVAYDPFFLLPGWKFRTRIEGRNLAVRFAGELAASQGVSETQVNRVEADLAFLDKGPPEVFKFVVQSPEFQFNLVKEPSSKTEN